MKKENKINWVTFLWEFFIWIFTALTFAYLWKEGEQNFTFFFIGLFLAGISLWLKRISEQLDELKKSK